jgi:hypothetical protein
MFNLKINTASVQISVPIYLKSIKGMLFFVALLILAIALIVPFSPNMPWEGLDPSWKYAVNEAVAQSMSFGKDIVFTFGPYASIYTRTYHPATDQMMIWGSLFLAISFTIAVYLNFKTTRGLLKLGLLVVLSTVMYSRDALFFFYPMLVGVQVYHWVQSIDLQRKEGITKIVLKVVLFAPFGLLPLIKGSALIACAAISVLSIALLARRGKWKLCTLIVLTPLVSLAFFWFLSGQPLIGLIAYLAGMMPIISGYTEAMAINGDPREYVLYSLAVGALVVTLTRQAKGSSYDITVLVLIFLCILFLAFKAGFVRHDDHAIIAGTMILLSALLAATLLNTRGSLALLSTCLVAWIYIDAAHIKTSTYNFKENITKSYVSAWIGLNHRLKGSEALEKSFEKATSELKKRGEIPKLDGSVDIYSYDQSYLIASGNKWSPRPIFQSYSVYTEKLAELNKMHLESKNRPENIIIKVQPIDGRLPSLEDGVSWPVILLNYDPSSFSNGYLILKSRFVSGHASEEPRKIGDGTYSLGEQINLPSSDEPLFVKVDIRKSFLGTVLNTLFKPSQLVIKLNLQNGLKREYRIIAGMSGSGFVISPLIENTEEFSLLFTDINYLTDKRVKSIEIVAPHFPIFWKKSFQLVFYRLNVKSSPSFIDKLDVVIPHVREFNKISTAHVCDGSIDFVNGVSPAPQSIRATTWLNIHGWLVASADLPDVSDKVYVVLSDANGKRYFIDTKRTQRPDVGAHFKEPALSLYGYTSKALVSNLVGDYNLGLAYLKGNEILICSQFNIPIKLN